MFKRFAILAGAALLAAQPALAQDAPQPPIEPVRLEAAKVTVGYIFPPGTYARVMQQTMGSTMDAMMDSVGKMSIRDMAAMTGMSPDELAKVGDGTLNQLLAILDPAYDERMRLTMQVMSKDMTAMMDQFEPTFRDGLARAYARRFTIRQLSELNRFFETPTGGLYAAESMVIMADPEVMQKMTELMPQIMKQMPAIMANLQQATAHLPKPKKASELSKAERARIAKLLGVPMNQLGR